MRRAFQIGKSMSDHRDTDMEVCDRCGGDGGGEYVDGHYGGEPNYVHVKCPDCDGMGYVKIEPDLLPGENLHARYDDLFSCDLDEEIPF